MDMSLCKKGGCQQEKIAAVPSARKKTGATEGTGAEVMLPLPKLRNGAQEGCGECFYSSDLFLVPVLPGQTELCSELWLGFPPVKQNVGDGVGRRRWMR